MLKDMEAFDPNFNLVTRNLIINKNFKQLNAIPPFLLRLLNHKAGSLFLHRLITVDVSKRIAVVLGGLSREISERMTLLLPLKPLGINVIISYARFLTPSFWVEHSKCFQAIKSTLKVQNPSDYTDIWTRIKEFIKHSLIKIKPESEILYGAEFKSLDDRLSQLLNSSIGMGCYLPYEGVHVKNLLESGITLEIDFPNSKNILYSRFINMRIFAYSAEFLCNLHDSDSENSVVATHIGRNLVTLLKDSDDVDSYEIQIIKKNPKYIEAAFQYGLTEFLKAISLRGVNLFESEEKYAKLLEKTIIKKDIEGLLLLVDCLNEKNITIDFTSFSPDKKTLLHCAIETKILVIVKIIAQIKNIDFNEVNAYQCTPLDSAIAMGLTDIARFLIIEMRKRNFSLFVPDDKGETALHLACCQSNVDLLKIFAEDESLDFNMPTKNSSTPLYFLVGERCFEGVVFVIAELKKRGLPILIRGTMTLHYAAEVGDPDILKLFLEEQVDLTIKDSIGNSILWTAIVRENKECASLLINELKKREQLDGLERYSDNNTLLHIASSTGNKEILELLLQATSFDFSMINDFGQTAEQLTREADHIEIADYLNKYNKTRSRLSP
jgi:ankyrin repeat protein